MKNDLPIFKYFLPRLIFAVPFFFFVILVIIGVERLDLGIWDLMNALCLCCLRIAGFHIVLALMLEVLLGF